MAARPKNSPISTWVYTIQSLHLCGAQRDRTQIRAEEGGVVKGWMDGERETGFTQRRVSSLRDNSLSSVSFNVELFMSNWFAKSIEMVLLNKLPDCAVCRIYTGKHQFEPILFSLSLLPSVADVDTVPFLLYYIFRIRDHSELRMVGFYSLKSRPRRQ